MPQIDEALQLLFGRAFPQVGMFCAATLHKATLTKNARKGMDKTFSDHTIQARRANWSQHYMAQNGIPATHIRLYVLQDGVSVPVSQDDEFTFQGSRYCAVGAVKQDGAGTYWDVQAAPSGT